MLHFHSLDKSRRLRLRQLCLLLCLCPALAHSQVTGSALEHVLQRPPVAKHYENKKFGDHLFVEAGGGLSSTPYGTKHFFKLEKPGFQGNMAIGDWVTPLHGWRVGMQGGTYRLGDTKTKAVGFTADYLLNLTALSAPRYDLPRPLEWSAVAGLEANWAHNATTTRKTIGAHLGLRGQVNFSNYTYFYIEPQFGFNEDNLYHTDTWRRYRLTGRVQAGLGYRLVPNVRKQQRDSSDGHFLNHTFVEFAAGPSLISNSSPSSWDNRRGARAQLSLGKWWNPYSGVRLTGAISTYRERPQNRAKVLSASAGYLLNLNNTFGGYDPNRKYWTNAVADVSASVSSAGTGRKFSMGVGGGLQAHFRMGQGASFFLEPRVDLMRGNYAPLIQTAGNWDLVPTVLAGFAFQQGGNTREQLLRNDDFEQATPYDHLFFDAGAGITMPTSSASIYRPGEYLDLQLSVGVGKWFTPTSGLRLWAEAKSLKPEKDTKYKTLAIGADYLWNLTNGLHGYDPQRHFDLIGAIGLNVAARQGGGHPRLGGNIGLRGVWNFNKMWGIYLEPQVRAYHRDFLPGNSFSLLKLDLTSALMAGVQVNLRDFVPAEARGEFEADDHRAFLSAAGGASTYGYNVKLTERYGAIGRLSFGKAFAPASLWRINLTGMGRNTSREHYARFTFGGDYLLDLSTLGMGYNPNRSLSLRALAGLDAGADYKSGGSRHFVAEVHGGAQLAVRAGEHAEIYAEPQVGYLMGGGHMDRRSNRVQSRLYLGVNYRLKTVSHEDITSSIPERPHFFSLGIGTGADTHTIQSMHPTRRKLTLNMDLAYGKWANAVSGYSIGLSDATVQVHGPGNKHITSVYANYMFNLLTAVGGASQLHSDWLLDGYVGASLNFGSRSGESTRVAPGVRAGLQLGHRVHGGWYLYVEPAVQVTSRNIWHGSTRPAEGQIRGLIGTRYTF